MHNKRPSKLLTAQKTSNSHGGPSERVVRKTRKDDHELAAEDKEKDETLDNCSEGKPPASDLLHLCRPLSVYLTRLPESLLNKKVDQKKKPVKRRKSFSCWKNGAIHKKRSRSRKPEREGGKYPQSLPSQTAENNSVSGESVTPDVTSMNINSTETSMAGPFPSDVGESTVRENETEEITANLEETSTSLAHEIRLSEAQECKISNSVWINAPSPIAEPKSDTSLNFEESELPKERELQIDESCDVAKNSALTTVEHADNRTLLAEENYNENSTVSQSLEGQTSLPTARHTRKRKNTSLSESSALQQSLQHSKKPRPYLSTPESSALPLEEQHATDSNEMAVTDPQQPALLTNVKNSRTTSMKQRVRAKKIGPIHEVIVVVNRLDDSRSPLVEKWKNRVDLSQLDEVTPNLRETLSISTSSINQIEKENEKEFEPAITGEVSEGIATYSPGSMDLPSFDSNGNTDIVMCDSNEDGSEEDDDDEIIEFLAAQQTTKSPTKIIHHGDKSDGELAEGQLRSRSRVKTSRANRSNPRSNVKRTRRQPRQRIQSCSTTDDANSEISSHSIRSRRIQSKISALRKTRNTRRPSYPKSDDSSCGENKSPPLTRSKSRAAIDHFYHDDSMNSNAVFHRKRNQKIWHPISYSDSSDEADETNEKMNEDESQVVIDSTQNVHDVVESEQIEKNDDLLDSATVNVSNVDSMNTNDVFSQKCNQKMWHLIYDSDSSDEADEGNEEINETENQAVVDTTENVHDVVETEQIEENDNSLNSAAAIDSTSTLIDTLQLKRDENIESSMARKKLATMKDAMVVLMRLEDLDNEYSDGDIGFEGTSDIDLPSTSAHETQEDDDDNISTDNVDAIRSFPCRSVDPLQLENSSVNQSLTPGKLLDNNDPQFVSDRENRRDNSISSRSKQTEQNHRHAKVFKPSVESESGRTLTRADSACQEMSESDDEGQLMVDESVGEGGEADVEPTLIIDECDKTTTKLMTRSQTEEVPIDTGGGNDMVKNPPGAKTPSTDLAESGKQCNCKEQRRDDGHHECQNISPSHRCIACNRLFKDAALLEEHKISSAFCSSGFRCDFCKSIFKTLIESSEHRSSCAQNKLGRRNSADAKTHEEIATPEPENSAVANSETSRSKGKKHKQATPKNQPKKNRSKPRCRSDNLTCNVCSTNFDSKTDLSEHLYKHSPEELQEAFRAAKAKAMADSRAEQTAKRKEVDSDITSDKTAENQVSSDTMITPANDNSLTQNLGAHETQIIMSNVDAIASNTFNSNLSTSRPATVCLCHRDVDLTSLDKTDLQIEMVLLCKYCHVIFRRRECLEVHYRTSSICSINRTRERCPSLFCANCQLTLNSWADMRQHLELHANQNSERTIRFVCNICRVVFVGFGALFYNHWTSHSKDSMFVAGRYNFPKFSVQTINGSEKLPAGARSDENYIFVAEHVCATCREPFSTRRDLEKHQQSASCTKQTPAQSKNNANTKPSERSNDAHPSVKGPKCQIAQLQRKPTNVRNNDSTKQSNANTKQNEGSATKSLSDGEKQNLIKTRMFCDVCHLAFINEYWLSMHSKNIHNNHFTFVPTTLSGNPLALPFKCNKCSAFAASVSAIEEHWRTDVLHQGPAALLKKKKPPRLSKTTTVTLSEDPGINVQNPSLNASIINVNDVTSTVKSKVSKEPQIITIDDPDSNSDSRASGDTPMNQNALTHNEESVISVPFITSTGSNQIPNINESAVLCDPLKNPPLLASDSNKNQRQKIRALEDPRVNVTLLEPSGTNLSASLVIGDTERKTKDNTLKSNTESYRILLPNQASPGNIKMIFSRTSSTDSAKEPGTISLIGSSVAENDKVAQAEGSNSLVPVGLDTAATQLLSAGTSVAEKDKVRQTKSSDSTVPIGLDGEPTLALLTGSSVVENSEIVQTKCSDSTVPIESDGEPILVLLTGSSVAEKNEVASTEGTASRENVESGLITKPPKPTLENMSKDCPRKSTNISVVPEIIDILDDAEECGNEPHTGQVNPTVIMTAEIRDNLLIDTNETRYSSLESRKSNADQTHTDPSRIIIDSSECLPVDKTLEASESRPGSEIGSNPTVNKSSSPGRSKMMKAALRLSSVSFEEERWTWLRSSSANRDIVNSTGPKKQGFLRVKDLSELQAARNYTCVICNSSFDSEKLLVEHRRMPRCGGSIRGRDNQYPRGISAALVLPDPSERPKTPESNLPSLLASMPNHTKSALRLALSSQPLSYPPQVIPSAPTAQRIQTTTHLPNIPVSNTSLGSWTSIGNPATFSTNSNHLQENRTFQQQQMATLSGGLMGRQDSNQGLPEIRNSSSGYHALPPIVGLPTVQTNKHQHMAAPQHVPSNNPLPKFTGRNAPIIIQQPDKTNKFLCTICHTFECMSLEAIKDHLKKHYHGWKTSTVTQDSRQPVPVARISAPSSDPIATPSLEMRPDGRQISSENMRVHTNTAANRPPLRNWTIKDTPQGPVLVRLASESNNNRTVLRQASLNANNLTPNPLYGGQLVFRCRICKSAVYKSYPPLRNHAILVHGITDFNSLDQVNISQNSYLCTQCPNTSALFDTEEEFREHVDSIHTHSCPSCQRVFTNFLTLRHHLEQCRVSTSSNRNTYGNNC